MKTTINRRQFIRTMGALGATALMKSMRLLTFSIVLSVISFSSAAQVSNLDTDLGKPYYYTDHFEVTINKPVSQVWPHVVEMGKWMPWMAGNDGNSGEVSEGRQINLYDNHYIEVVKVIPEKMILLTNLPGTDQGETSQGIAMVSVAESEGKTLVSIYMSRVYYWFDTRENPQRITRESTGFAKQREAMFKNNFLAKLKQLAESPRQFGPANANKQE